MEAGRPPVLADAKRAPSEETMEITKVLQAELAGGRTTLTVEDSNGRQRQVSLSERAELQLLSALLTNPVSKVGRPMARGPLVALSTAVMETKDGTFAIEVLLGPRSALHIALPGTLRQVLAQQLIDPQWPSPPH